MERSIYSRPAYGCSFEDPQKDCIAVITDLSRSSERVDVLQSRCLAFLGHLLDGAWRESIDEFAEDDSVVEKVLQRHSFRLGVAGHRRYPCQHFSFRLRTAAWLNFVRGLRF